MLKKNIVYFIEIFRTALIYALESGNIEMINFLIKQNGINTKISK